MAKKDFSSIATPALQFISNQDTEQLKKEKDTTPEGYKVNPVYVEKKKQTVTVADAT